MKKTVIIPRELLIELLDDAIHIYNKLCIQIENKDSLVLKKQENLIQEVEELLNQQ